MRCSSHGTGSVTAEYCAEAAPESNQHSLNTQVSQLQCDISTHSLSHSSSFYFKTHTSASKSHLTRISQRFPTHMRRSFVINFYSSTISRWCSSESDHASYDGQALGLRCAPLAVPLQGSPSSLDLGQAPWRCFAPPSAASIGGAPETPSTSAPGRRRLA